MMSAKKELITYVLQEMENAVSPRSYRSKVSVGFMEGREAANVRPERLNFGEN